MSGSPSCRQRQRIHCSQCRPEGKGAVVPPVSPSRPSGRHRFPLNGRCPQRLNETGPRAAKGSRIPPPPPPVSPNPGNSGEWCGRRSVRDVRSPVPASVPEARTDCPHRPEVPAMLLLRPRTRTAPGPHPDCTRTRTRNRGRHRTWTTSRTRTPDPHPDRTRTRGGHRARPSPPAAPARARRPHPPPARERRPWPAARSPGARPGTLP